MAASLQDSATMKHKIYGRLAEARLCRNGDETPEGRPPRSEQCGHVAHGVAHGPSQSGNQIPAFGPPKIRRRNLDATSTPERE